MFRITLILLASVCFKQRVECIRHKRYLETFKGQSFIELKCPQSSGKRLLEYQTNIDPILQTVVSISKLSSFEKERWDVLEIRAIRNVNNDRYNPILTLTGTACVFPFEYEDQSRLHKEYSCKSGGLKGGGSSGCWCGTAPQLSQDNWGYCPCASPILGIPLITEVIDGVGGEPCHFPFLFQGIEHFTCITSDLYEVPYCFCGIQYKADSEDHPSNQLPPTLRKCPCGRTNLEGSWNAWSRWSHCQCGELTARKRNCGTDLTNVPPGILTCPGQSTEIAVCGCNFEDRLTQVGSLVMRTSWVHNIHKDSENSDSTTFRIANLKMSDAGDYKCNELFVKGSRNESNDHLNRFETRTYFLDVVDALTLDVMFRTKLPYNTARHGNDLVMLKQGSWQECDRCGILVGEQRKYGFCYTTHPTGSRHWLPCSSTLLPEDKRERMSKYKDIVAIRECQSRCVIDDDDFTIVKAMPGEMPSMPPPVVREIVKKYKGERLQFECIGGDLFKPVNWQYDGLDGTIKILLRGRVKEGEFKRFASFIDARDTLFLNEVVEESEGYYSCFVNRTLMVSYRLIVEKKVFWALEQILDNLIYVSLAVVVVIFILTLIATFSRRKKSPGI